MLDVFVNFVNLKSEKVENLELGLLCIPTNSIQPVWRSLARNRRASGALVLAWGGCLLVVSTLLSVVGVARRLDLGSLEWRFVLHHI